MEGVKPTSEKYIKKRNQIRTVLFFLVIYFVGIGFSTHTSNITFALVDVSKPQEKNFIDASPPLCFHVISSKNTSTRVQEFLSSSTYQDEQVFVALILALGLCLYAFFKQYKNFLNNILVRYKKSDLIYPFHTFW